MNTPHLGLMRAYDTTDVFFKKASAGMRTLDEVSFSVAGPFLSKLARGVAPMPAVGRVAAKPPPLPARASAKPATAAVPPAPQGGPDVVTSAPAVGRLAPPPARPAAGALQPPVRSPLAGMPAAPASGGAAPNLSHFAPPPGMLQRAAGRLGVGGGAPASPTGAPTINPMAGTDAPAAVNQKVQAPAAAAAKGKAAPLISKKMMLAGGVLGAGYLGLKGLQAGLGVLGGGHGGPADYGSAPGGYMPPMGVNAYGQPQMGSPMM